MYNLSLAPNTAAVSRAADKDKQSAFQQQQQLSSSNS